MNWLILNERIIEILITALVGAVTYLIRNTIQIAKARKRADKALIRYNITMMHREFMSLGYIDRYSLDALIEFENVYMGLTANAKNNGYAQKLIDDLKTLPIKE